MLVQLSITLFMLTPPAPSAEPPSDSALVAALASCEALAECTAATTLVKRGNSAVPAIIAGLTHSEELVRFWSCGVLSELRPKDAFTPLLKAFQTDPKIRVRNAALYALGSLQDTRAIAPLSLAMKQKDPNVRIAAMMGLSLLGAKETIPTIQRAISDRDEEVRAMAMITLADMGDETAESAITLRLSEDIKASVRAAACVALSKLGLLPQRLSAVTKAVQTERNLQARAECAASLGRLGAPESLPTLNALVGEPEPLGSAAKWAIQEIVRRQKTIR